jgi:hypothetical protein
VTVERDGTGAKTYSAAEVAQIASEAVRVALERFGPPSPQPTPPPADPFCDTAEVARRMGKTAKTIRGYLRFVPRGDKAFAWKYGRDWRIQYDAFAKWVRDGGPRLAAEQIGRMQGRALQ